MLNLWERKVKPQLESGPLMIQNMEDSSYRQRYRERCKIEISAQGAGADLIKALKLNQKKDNKIKFSKTGEDAIINLMAEGITSLLTNYCQWNNHKPIKEEDFTITIGTDVDESMKR